jgi:hypothetical protein
MGSMRSTACDLNQGIQASGKTIGFTGVWGKFRWRFGETEPCLAQVWPIAHVGCTKAVP